jgi:hypothetical protein
MLNYIPGTLHFPFHWRIKIEPVFRLLNEVEYANNFFDKGEIMLSCFNNFRKYPDEIQGDVNEGNASIGGTDEKGNMKFVNYNAGFNAYILSTTNKLNETIIGDFKAKCAIKINQPTVFAHELSRKIPHVTSGLEGNCDYASSRLHFIKEMEANKDFQEIDFVNDPQKGNITMSELTMGMELFLKLNKYSYQKEYRLIWFAKKTIDHSIIVYCPEAIEYCEKIIF